MSNGELDWQYVYGLKSMSVQHKQRIRHYPAKTTRMTPERALTSTECHHQNALDIIIHETRSSQE